MCRMIGLKTPEVRLGFWRSVVYEVVGEVVYYIPKETSRVEGTCPGEREHEKEGYENWYHNEPSGERGEDKTLRIKWHLVVLSVYHEMEGNGQGVFRYHMEYKSMQAVLNKCPGEQS